MTSHTPTPEQQLIISAVTSSSSNLLISALAGAAKTSTLILIAQALPTIPILSLAFNKRIAEEMKERMPSNVECMTLNSIGHRAWSSAIGQRLIIKPSKTYDLLKLEIDRLRNAEEKSEAYETMSETIKAIDWGKTQGYVPSGHFLNAKAVCRDEDFFDQLDVEPSALQMELIVRVSCESISRAYKGECDYNDQILLPTIFGASFPQYQVVLGDEVQDFSSLNLTMLKKIARKRFIGVGDECQAIYGFRGAHATAMDEMQKAFDMQRFLLSVSFRCPIDVVMEARWRAPHMKWPEWAIPGGVFHYTNWSESDLPEEAAVICRNNAPIFRLAMKLLQSGRHPQILGNDIGKGLMKIMKKFGPTSLSQEQVFDAIEQWTEDKLKKSRTPGSIHDQAACMKVFAEAGTNLGDAIAYAEHIFAQHGPIKLMTGHKAKGLEFDFVFILDRELIKTEVEQQEKNLLYVMQTRAKKTLTYVSSERFQHV
jgi:superfamily I DNA/RNA helicase